MSELFLKEDDKCSMCPRECNVKRSLMRGFCNSKDIVHVSKHMLHMWEEPCISGVKGSGAIFFSGCNMRCVFCQNMKISRCHNEGSEYDSRSLADLFLNMNDKASNINLVTPMHYISQIREALVLAKSNGLSVPVVYNTNSYEKAEFIEELKGIIDIYLPDLKYFDDRFAMKYSDTKRYFEFATKAIVEMFSQVGHIEKDSNGLATKGLLVRHLVLPNLSDDSIKILEWIRKELGKYVHISIMSQYTPVRKLELFSEIDRKISQEEYERVVNKALDLGFMNIYVQDISSATTRYIPSF